MIYVTSASVKNYSNVLHFSAVNGMFQNSSNIGNGNTVNSQQKQTHTTAAVNNPKKSSSTNEGEYQLIEHEVLSSPYFQYEVLEFLGKGDILIDNAIFRCINNIV